MKILFSEIERKEACTTAEALVRREGFQVYVLQCPEEQVLCEGVTVLPVAKRRQGEIEEALKKANLDTLDLLVLSASQHAPMDGKVGSGRDYEAMLNVLAENVNGNLETVRAALPYMERGEKKRIALLSDKSASVTAGRETEDYAYLMSQAALHMVEKLLFNQLRKKGYTFRCYGLDKEFEKNTGDNAASKSSGITPAEYFLMDFSYCVTEPACHNEEDRFVMRDQQLLEIPF